MLIYIIMEVYFLNKKAIHNKKIFLKKSMVSFLCISVLSGSVFPYSALATESIEKTNTQEYSSTIEDEQNINKDSESIVEDSEKEKVLEQTEDDIVEEPIQSEEEQLTEVKESMEVPEDSSTPVEEKESQNIPVIEEKEVSEEISDFSLEENRQNAWETFLSANNGNMMRSRAISPTAAFIANVGPQAKKVAASNGLYASVMIAQAALESDWGRSGLASAPNYNLFGIKGSYNGSYVAMKTSEYSKAKGWYNIIANFRKYPSYSQSFQDNANLLRTGVNYNNGIYSGAWLENTINYGQATEHLEGIYATDPSYDTKLNSIIEQYNLTQYDTYDSVTSSNKNSYTAKLTSVDIFSRPNGMYNAKKITNSGLSVGSEITVKQEMRTQSGVFAKIHNSDNKFIGWVNKDLIRIYDTSLGSKPKNYLNRVESSIAGIYTKPYNLKGSEIISNGSAYIGKYVQIKQEMTTQSGTYGNAYLNGTFIGWIKTSDLTYDTNLKSKSKNYTAEISNGLTGIYTKPFGMENAKVIKIYSNYVGKQVTIQQEMTTQSGTYAKVYYKNSFIGWVNIKELTTYDTNLESKSKNYSVTLPSNISKIFTKPYNMKGNEIISNVSSYANKDVQIKQEMKTQSGTYAKITFNDDFIGWARTSDLTYDTNLKSTQKSYSATVKSGNDGIYTKPKYFKGATIVNNSNTFVNKKVQVRQLMKTNHGNYAKIHSNNKFVGWVLESDLK